MFWLWALLTLLFHRPLVTGVVILVLWLALDRAWFDRARTMQWFGRRRAATRLRTTLEVNPHDRDARFQLAEILVGQGHCDEARELIEANLRAGDRDDETLFVAGRAAFGSSAEDARERGEEHLAAAREKSPTFRAGAIEMELGRGRLRHDRPAEAEEALRAAIEAQPGSVQAHVLLSQALTAQGKTDAARQARADAWKHYLDAPRFKRRQDRTWAWRANPLAAARYFGTIAVVIIAVVVVVPRLIPDSYNYDGDYYRGEVDGYNVDTDNAPRADRFTVVPGAEPQPSAAVMPRWDLDGNEIVDQRRKLQPGDAYCRLMQHYPQAADFEPVPLTVTDHERGATFTFSPLGAHYSADASARESVLAFEALLESEDPADCEYSYGGGRITIGLRYGSPFTMTMELPDGRSIEAR